MNQPSIRTSLPLRAIRSRVAKGVAVSSVTLLLGLVALHLLGFDLERQFWLTKTRFLGKEPVGIWRDDSRYGWSHKPNATGRHREVPDFDVRYHIDSSGRRITPGAPENSARTVLFLGGSFTFGHGVADDEPYPALLQQRWPEYECVNAGVNAWGTTQALLTLQDELEKDEQLDLVVYGFISHHLSRNHLRRAWLDVLQTGRGRRNPWFELEGEQLVLQGLADPQLDGLEGSAELRAKELLLTTRMLAEMSALCASRGIPFVAVYLADGNSEFDFFQLTRALDPQQAVDLRSELNFGEMHFEHNRHYSAKGHRLVADALAPYLESRLR